MMHGTINIKYIVDVEISTLTRSCALYLNTHKVHLEKKTLMMASNGRNM